MNIWELATQLEAPGLPNMLRRFLYDQKYPDQDPDSQVSIESCPTHDKPLQIVRSASARFYAPSDLCELTGHRVEHIRAAPSWRKGPARYDTVLVQTDQDSGPNGLLVARIVLLLRFKFEGVEQTAACVQWFQYAHNTPDEDTGMYIVEHELQQDDTPTLGIIHTDTILRACHLIPVFGNNPLPRQITLHNSLDLFNLYYLNKFADHHVFEILS